MIKITCDIVRDLIPLYVDEVLSEDSRLLVEGHLNTCSECKKYCEKLAVGIPASSGSAYKSKEVLKGLKRKINLKRLTTACIAAVCVIAACGITFYGLFIHEDYVDYNDSGLYVENNTLKTDTDYYCYYGWSGDNNRDKLFIFLSTTEYKKMHPQTAVTEMQHFDKNGDSVSEVKEIYYLPENLADLVKDSKISTNDENVDEFIQASTLIWKAK